MMSNNIILIQCFSQNIEFLGEGVMNSLLNLSYIQTEYMKLYISLKALLRRKSTIVGKLSHTLKSSCARLGQFHFRKNIVN
jgi:hypothetical protein